MSGFTPLAVGGNVSHYLAPSLARLRAQVNDLWPRRDKASDGWIGDTSHGARVSDHNPDYASGGVVRAIDIDKDGIDVNRLINAATSDSRTAYVIWNRRIWTRGVGWKPYTGSNGHTAHIHVSIRHGASDAASTAAWALSPTVATGSVSTAARTAIATYQGDKTVKLFRQVSTGGVILVTPRGNIDVIGPDLVALQDAFGPAVGVTDYMFLKLKGLG